MPLSVGLEFETIVLSLIPPAPIPSDKQAKLKIVVDAIKASGLVIRSYTSPRNQWRYHDYMPPAWYTFIDNTINRPGIIKYTIPYSEAPDRVYESRFGVILGSPTFFNADSGKWKHKVRTALSAVGQRVNWKAQGHPTGLHIRVGLDGDEEFTLPQLKRLACFICRFENALDSDPIRGPIHRTNFKENDNIGSNRYNGLLRVMSIDKVYGTIQEVADIGGLIEVMNFIPESNFHNLIEQFKVNFRTVPWDHVVSFCHKGTISMDSVIDWVEFILRFVQFAIDATDDVIQSEGNTLMDLGAYVRLPKFI